MFNSNAKSARPVETDEKIEIKLMPAAVMLATKDDEQLEKACQALRALVKATRERFDVQR